MYIEVLAYAYIHTVISVASVMPNLSLLLYLIWGAAEHCYPLIAVDYHD